MHDKQRIVAGLVEHLAWEAKAAEEFIRSWSADEIDDALEHLRAAVTPSVGLACVIYGIRRRQAAGDRVAWDLAQKEAQRHHKIIKTQPLVLRHTSGETD